MLALAPCFILLHSIYVLDRYEKEPIRNLIRYLLAGAGAIPVAIIIQVAINIALGRPVRGYVWEQSVEMLVGGGFVEEGLKLLALVTLARKDRELNEPFDWIVYSVSVALGFAALENVAYVLQFGPAVGIMRAFTAVPGHALDGTMMGYHLTMASMTPGPHVMRAILAVVEPALWHGTYDVLVGVSVANRDTANAMHLLWLLLVVAQWVVCVRRVKRLRTERPGSRIPPVLYPLLPFYRVRWPEGPSPRPPHRPRSAAPPRP